MAGRQRRKDVPGQPEETDEREDMRDLNFHSDDELEPPPHKGPDPDDEVRNAGLTGASMPEDASTEDDLTPETLFHEDGVRWPNEPHDEVPPDEQFKEVNLDEVGAGEGLDEAELGRVKPLDKKPWDGDPSAPLGPGPTAEADEEFPSGDEEPDKAREEDEEYSGS